MNNECLPRLRTALRGAGRRDLSALSDGDLKPLADLCGREPYLPTLIAATLRQRPAWTVAHYLDSYQAVAEPTDQPPMGLLRLTLSQVAGERPMLATRWFLLAALGPAPFHLDMATALWDLEETPGQRVERWLERLEDWALLLRYSREYFQVPVPLREQALNQQLKLPGAPTREQWQTARLLLFDHCLDACEAIADLADEDARAARIEFGRLWPHLATVVELVGGGDEVVEALAQLPPSITSSVRFEQVGPRMQGLALAAWVPQRRAPPGPGQHALDEGRTLRTQGQLEQSLARFQQALAAFRTSRSIEGEAEALTEIGITLIALDRPEEALAALQQVVKYHAQQPLADQVWVHTLIGLGMASNAMGDTAAALNALAEARTLLSAVDEPTLQAEVEATLGQLYLEMGTWRRALDHLTTALALAPEDSAQYRKVGRLIVQASRQGGELSEPDRAALQATVRWLREHGGVDA